MNRKFHFDDILIQPTLFSEIDYRSQINPFDENGYLPLFTAPMYDVVDESNWQIYNENKIISIIPRGKWNGGSTSFNKWRAVSLDEFINEYIANVKNIETTEYVLIDVANGHMEKLYSAAKGAKVIYGDKLILMVGNIANPETYKEYCKIGVDYVRLGIGSGSVCTTSANGAIGYPLASLIKECNNIRNFHDLKTSAKIVADGGIRDFADIIKALALGADYVMLGSIFNKALESSGGCYMDPLKDLDGYRMEKLTKAQAKKQWEQKEFPVYKKYRGMSTKEIQHEMGKATLKTSEGIVKYNRVEYTLSSWVDNFKHYLTSNMSYTGSNKLETFIGCPNYNLITENAFKGFSK